MSISIHSRNNIYSNIFSKAYPQNNHAQKDFTEDEYSLRKQEYAQRLQEKNKGSVVDQAMTYADQLKTSRTKAKETALEKKKLQYNFKKISSQIVRSKNSVSARKAVQSAKREIMRLKRLKANGEYDEEEVQLAIDHAKAMEKVAKKKVAHLEQEEMVERAHKGAGAALEEIQENKELKNILNLKLIKIFQEYINSKEFNIDEINRLKSKNMKDSYIKRYIYLAQNFIQFITE